MLVLRVHVPGPEAFETSPGLCVDRVVDWLRMAVRHDEGRRVVGVG